MLSVMIIAYQSGYQQCFLCKQQEVWIIGTGQRKPGNIKF
jgi:hypothetical protein